MLCLFLQVIGRYKKNVKPISAKYSKKKKKFLKSTNLGKIYQKTQSQRAGTRGSYRFGFELFLIAGGTGPAPTGFFLRFRLQKILIL